MSEARCRIGQREGTGVVILSKYIIIVIYYIICNPYIYIYYIYIYVHYSATGPAS